MKRIPTSLLSLIALAIALVACVATQLPGIRQSLVYGERFTWNAYPVPGNVRDVVTSNVALSGSEDTRLNYVTRLSSAGQLVWETAPMIAPENKPVVALSVDAVIVAFNNQLTALALSDGKLLWEAKLMGRMGFCDTCLVIAGDRVVAYSDKALEGFDLATGKGVWAQRVPRNVPTVQWAGEGLAVVLPQTINVYRPADGEIGLQIPVQCEGAQQAGMPRDTSPILLGERGSDNFYVRLDTCVQRWGLKEGKRLWDVAFEKDTLGRLGNFKGVLRREQTEMIQAGVHVFVSTGESAQQKSPRGLVMIDAESGVARQLATSDDHYLIPAALSNDQVLVRAKHFRGATFDELWAIDIQTGKTTWRFQSEQLAEWDVLPVQAAQGIALVQFGERETTRQVKPFLTRAVRSDAVVQFLNPQTGAATAQPLRMELADANWVEAVVDTTASTLFLNFGTLYAIDLNTLNSLYRWP